MVKKSPKGSPKKYRKINNKPVDSKLNTITLYYPILSVKRPPNQDPITEPIPNALITQAILFMLKSKSMMGVNMLHIGDNRPMVLKRCLENVVELVEKGVLDPKVAKVFPASQLVEAHEYLEGRKSMGKISVTW